MKTRIPKSFYLLGVIALNLTVVAVPAQAPKFQTQENHVAWARAQLQERALNNREKIVLKNAALAKQELFRQYPDLNTPKELIKVALKEENFIYQNQIDPAVTKDLKFKVKKPFLTQRGIKEVIGVGVIDTDKNIKSDIVNINKGIEKLDGYIIKKGETFSFNTQIGPITEKNGFVNSLITDGGRTSTEVGGGVCQLSTGLFRAALSTGMDITERRNHSRVIPAYYPIGLDATIYQGQQDMKFTNNTPGDVMLHFVKSGEKIAVFLIGTDDGRSVEITRKEAYWSKGNLISKWRRVINTNGTVNDETFTATYRDASFASSKDLDEIL